MKSTCVLIIVCAMNVNFSRFNNKPAGWRVFLWVRGVFFCGCVGVWGVFLWVRWCVGVFVFFVGLWGFIEDYQFMGDLWWDLR